MPAQQLCRSAAVPLSSCAAQQLCRSAAVPLVGRYKLQIRRLGGFSACPALNPSFNCQCYDQANPFAPPQGILQDIPQFQVINGSETPATIFGVVRGTTLGEDRADKRNKMCHLLPGESCVVTNDFVPVFGSDSPGSYCQDFGDTSCYKQFQTDWHSFS
jgi:hypothetical protein